MDKLSLESTTLGGTEFLPRVLVCTDLAARGLDIPAIQHVIMFDFPLNSLDYLHRCGRTARGIATPSAVSSTQKSKVTAFVTKRDMVLANAIERAVRTGQPLDGLSSRKTDYQPGGKLAPSSKAKSSKKSTQFLPTGKRKSGPSSSKSGSSSTSSSNNKGKRTSVSSSSSSSSSSRFATSTKQSSKNTKKNRKQ